MHMSAKRSAFIIIYLGELSTMEGMERKIQYLEENFVTLTDLDDKQEHKVFLVKRKCDGRIYVKKYVSPEAARTCQRLQGLKNRNVAEIYETAWNESTGILIEEFINGTTLGEYLRGWGILEENQACQMVRELCGGLFDIHNLGIVHRDMKPENIMLSNDGVLKIIDFGIARVMKEDQATDTAILGTAGYAAPEQFGYMQTDARADIYAMGALLNKLLTGKLPADSLYEVQPVSGIIGRCLEMDARNRFQTVQELRRTIEISLPESFASAGMCETESCRTAANQMKGNGSLGGGARNGRRTAEKRSGCVIKGVPGFRTGALWKNVVAAIGYSFLVLGTVIWMEPFTVSVQAFLVGGLGVFLYAWAATLIGFNVGYWDRKLFPVRLLPKEVMLVVRIFLWMLIFYMGGTLQNYVKYEMIGMIR